MTLRLHGLFNFISAQNLLVREYMNLAAARKKKAQK